MTSFKEFVLLIAHFGDVPSVTTGSKKVRQLCVQIVKRQIKIALKIEAKAFGNCLCYKVRRADEILETDQQRLGAVFRIPGPKMLGPRTEHVVAIDDPLYALRTALREVKMMIGDYASATISDDVYGRFVILWHIVRLNKQT